MAATAAAYKIVRKSEDAFIDARRLLPVRLPGASKAIAKRPAAAMAAAKAAAAPAHRRRRAADDSSEDERHSDTSEESSSSDASSDSDESDETSSDGASSGDESDASGATSDEEPAPLRPRRGVRAGRDRPPAKRRQERGRGMQMLAAAEAQVAAGAGAAAAKAAADSRAVRAKTDEELAKRYAAANELAAARNIAWWRYRCAVAREVVNFAYHDKAHESAPARVREAFAERRAKVRKEAARMAAGATSLPPSSGETYKAVMRFALPLMSKRTDMSVSDLHIELGVSELIFRMLYRAMRARDGARTTQDMDTRAVYGKTIPGTSEHELQARLAAVGFSFKRIDRTSLTGPWARKLAAPCTSAPRPPAWGAARAWTNWHWALELVRGDASVHAACTDLTDAWLPLRPLVRAAHDLSAAELASLRTYVQRFAAATVTHRVALPVKPHILTAHVAAFAAKHGSVGRFTESVIEQVHQLMKKIERAFANVVGSAHLAAVAGRHLALWTARTLRAREGDAAP